jgi:hypothetical protein
MSFRSTKAKAPSVAPVSAGGTATVLTTIPTWILFTVTHTQLQAAALANDIELWSMPARGCIHHVMFEPTIIFAGTGITDYKIGLGINGNLSKYHSFIDEDTAVSATNFDSAGLFSAESTSGVTSVRVAAMSLGANLNQSTSGALNIAILASKWR